MNHIKLLVAEAVKINPTEVGVPNPPAGSVITNALNIFYFSAGIVAVIVIILAGYTFTTAVYDPAKITQAKNALLYAVIGLIVIIFAFTITQVIAGKF
jgi:hypothetical protein